MNRRRLLQVLGLGCIAAGGWATGIAGLELSPYVQDIADQSKLEEYMQKKYGVWIIGDTRAANMLLLFNVIRSCEKNWDQFEAHINPVSQIDFRSWLANLKEWWDGGIARAEVEYYEEGTVSTIRIASSSKSSDFIHELAHIYHFNLQNKATFERQWRAVANTRYGTLCERRKTKKGKRMHFWKGTNAWKAKHGFMRAYGAKNLHEDVATYTEQLFKFLYQLKRHPGDYGRIYEKYFICNPKGDSRYKNKLELLAQNDFISPREYRALRPLF